jgi:hypothetical protein
MTLFDNAIKVKYEIRHVIRREEKVYFPHSLQGSWLLVIIIKGRFTREKHNRSI